MVRHSLIQGVMRTDVQMYIYIIYVSVYCLLLCTIIDICSHVFLQFLLITDSVLQNAVLKCSVKLNCIPLLHFLNASHYKMLQPCCIHVYVRILLPVVHVYVCTYSVYIQLETKLYIIVATLVFQEVHVCVCTCSSAVLV